MVVKYRHEIADDVVEALTAEATDYDIAHALADLLLAGQTPPLTLVLNHNSKAAPCPVRIDKPGIKSSSVVIHKIPEARIWIVDALTRGYGVCCGARRDLELRTIAGVRQSITYRGRARPRVEDDDEISF
jgi:hypothetical protein